MSEPISLYILQCADGSFICGAHPWGTVEEADTAKQRAIADGFDSPRVVHLVEERCSTCRYNSAACTQVDCDEGAAEDVKP